MAPARTEATAFPAIGKAELRLIDIGCVRATRCCSRYREATRSNLGRSFPVKLIDEAPDANVHHQAQRQKNKQRN
jgi:hypothetical protein